MPAIPQPTPKMVDPIRSLESIFPPLGIDHFPPRRARSSPRPYRYRSIPRDRALAPSIARDGSNARWKGSKRKEMTRDASLRFDKRNANANWTLVARKARRRREDLGLLSIFFDSGSESPGSCLAFKSYIRCKKISL